MITSRRSLPIVWDNASNLGGKEELYTFLEDY